jgi:acylphosphatase
MAAMSMQRVIVHGRVQGVNFRSFVMDKAIALDVEGWVRNLPDGTVEAFFSGPQSQVEAMVDSCRTGPRFAHVTKVDMLGANSDDLRLRRPGERFSRLG